MLTMSTIRDTYAATEEKESGFNSVSDCGFFDENGDYHFYDQPFQHDDYLLWC